MRLLIGVEAVPVSVEIEVLAVSGIALGLAYQGIQNGLSVSRATELAPPEGELERGFERTVNARNAALSDLSWWLVVVVCLASRVWSVAHIFSDAQGAKH